MVDIMITLEVGRVKPHPTQLLLLQLLPPNASLSIVVRDIGLKSISPLFSKGS